VIVANEPEPVLNAHDKFRQRSASDVIVQIMPYIPAAPPQPVAIYSGFDYVVADSQRRRIYAAHTTSRTLLVVDADTGKVTGQVRVGPMHGIAIDPATGHVFTGNGTDRTVSEVDPGTLKVLRSASVDGAVDAIAFDPATDHIYADEDEGTHVYVVDAKAMKSIATIDIPGRKPEYLSVDPATGDVYQNISYPGQIAVIDPQTLTIKRIIKTPELRVNHPLQYDSRRHRILVAGTNGVLSLYDTSGKLLASQTVQDGIDQCSLDQVSGTIACAGNELVTVLKETSNGPPVVVARMPVPMSVHTVGIDSKTGYVWIVWSQPDGDFVQPFKASS